jgi:hypothetical protein
VAAALALMLGATSVANAAFLTSNTIGRPTVVDFSDQPTVINSGGPIQVGGLVGQDISVVMTDGSDNLSANFNSWNLGSNGDWADPHTYFQGSCQRGDTDPATLRTGS